MKHQDLFSVKKMKQYSNLSSAAVVIGAVRFKVNKYTVMESTCHFHFCLPSQW